MDDLEYRYYFKGELMCPNPMEYYKMTRSFEDMKFEHNLLHSHEITEEDIQMHFKKDLHHYWYYLPILIQLFIILFLVKYV